MKLVTGWERVEKFTDLAPKWIATLECGHTREFTSSVMQTAPESPLQKTELECLVCDRNEQIADQPSAD